MNSQTANDWRGNSYAKRPDQRNSITSPDNYYYHADGNGNITALLNSGNEIAARYLYDPFGNIVSASGPLASFNRYRFSSKEAHANSGLSLYEFRPYDPNLQRWLNQDPLGEEGRINLYQFVGNDPINLLNPVGLSQEGAMAGYGETGGLYPQQLPRPPGAKTWPIFDPREPLI